MAWISEIKKKLLELQKRFIKEDFETKKQKLKYFGMPSGDIIDFELWHEYLGNQLIAVEYDKEQIELLHESINNNLRSSEDGSLKIFGTISLDEFYGPYYLDVNELLVNIRDNEKNVSDNIFYFNPQYPFDVVSLGYTSFFGSKHKKAFLSLLEILKREYEKRRQKKYKDFLLFYSVNAQRTNNQLDKIEIDNLLMDAKGWSVGPKNSAAEIFEWLQEEERLYRDKLIVALPYFIMRESFKLGFDPEPLGIYLWQTEMRNNYFLCVAFRFSHLEKEYYRAPNEKLARVPIKDVKLIEENGVSDYKTDMPEFKILDDDQ